MGPEYPFSVYFFIGAGYPNVYPGISEQMEKCIRVLHFTSAFRLTFEPAFIIRNLRSNVFQCMENSAYRYLTLPRKNVGRKAKHTGYISHLPWNLNNWGRITRTAISINIRYNPTTRNVNNIMLIQERG